MYLKLELQSINNLKTGIRVEIRYMDSCELRDKCKLHGTPKIQSFIKFTKTTVVEAGSFMIN